MTKDIKEKILWNYVFLNPYIPHNPFPNQMEFLSLPNLEALYGGRAGGGKSDALLMAALMFVEIPGYNAILFRKTYSDLNLPEAIMNRSHEWLAGTDAIWNGSDYRWTFPSGGTLSFGYLNHAKDKYRYQSSAFQFIGFDELTQFEEDPYRYLFSRLRGPIDSPIPLRMRGATNPGGVGHQWVLERFIVDKTRPFIPSKLSDNPFIDQDEYTKSLENLGEIEFKQLAGGEWVLDPTGKPFKREWWRGKNRFLLNDLDERAIGRWISWDTALEDKETNAYSAYTVGELTLSYKLRIMKVWRDRPIFPELPDVILEEARAWNHDGLLKGIIIEGKASGKPAIQTLRAGSDLDIASKIIEFSPRGSKEERGNQAGIWCARNMVQLPFPGPEVPWLPVFETELFSVPESTFKDQADSFAQLIIYLENYLAVGWQKDKRIAEKKIDSRIKRAMSRV